MNMASSGIILYVLNVELEFNWYITIIKIFIRVQGEELFELSKHNSLI